MIDPTATDRRRQVANMLGDPETAALSDREIARRCGVSHPAVARMRRALAPVPCEPNQTTEVPPPRPDDGRHPAKNPAPVPMPVADRPTFPLLPSGRQVWPAAKLSDVDLVSLIEGLGAGLVALQCDDRQRALLAVLDGQVSLAYSVAGGTHRHGAAALAAVHEIRTGIVMVEALPREVVSGLAPSWPRPATAEDLEAFIASTPTSSLQVSTPRGLAWLLVVEGHLVGAWSDWGDTTTDGVVASVIAAGSWVLSMAVVPVPERHPGLDAPRQPVTRPPSPSAEASSAAAGETELPLWPPDRPAEPERASESPIQAGDREFPDLLAKLCDVGDTHLGVYGPDVRRVLLTEPATLAGLRSAVRRINRTALHPAQWDRLAPLMAQLEEAISGWESTEE